MPVIKSAIKKLRQDKKKTAVNKKIKQQLDSVVKGIKKAKKTSLEEAYSKIDKAAKRGVIHSNKAARLKSQLSKIAPKKVTAKTSPKPKKAILKTTTSKPKKSTKK